MNKCHQDLVSIIVPTYNHAHFLARALNSIHRQTWKMWEVIVVDNHSTDNTDDVMKSWVGDRVRLLKIKNNGLIAASRNMGIRHARGNWVAFLDSDDWWKERKLERSMRVAMNGADVVYHDLAVVAVDEKVSLLRRATCRSLESTAYRDLFLNGNGLPNSSVLVKKEKILEIGLLSEDPDLVGWEDYDCWLRLARINCAFARAPGCNGYYWVGGGNVTNPKRSLDNINAFIKRYALLRDEIPWWCFFSMAVAYNKLGETQLASNNFFEALCAARKIRYKLKSLIYLMAYRFLINIRNSNND